MKVRCPICRGTKKLMKLGGMKVPCPFCDGTGWIEDKPEGKKKNGENKSIR